MSRISKQKKAALAKFDKSKSYFLNEAVDIVKQITYTGVAGNFFPGLKKQAMEFPVGSGLEVVQ